LKILFICTGNINRSAAAHVILSSHSNGKYEVDSCGTSKATQTSPRMAPKMRRIMREMGYDGESHLGKPCDQRLLNWADLIVCMSHKHVSFIDKHFEVEMSKVVNWDIVDPFFFKGDEVHRKVAHEIRELVFLHFPD
jgi:protein-tyrosine-phosphatase